MTRDEIAEGLNIRIVTGRWTMAKPKWDWQRWLTALDGAKISARAKQLGHEVHSLMRKRKSAFGPWELESAPGYHELSPLIYAGLLYLIPAVGHFVPDYDPLPQPSSIKVTPAQRKIIRLLLAGGDFYFTEPDSRYSTPGWRMRRDWNGPTIPVSQRGATRLQKIGLLEWDGCGNWPVFDHRRYVLNMRRLHGVKGFVATSKRWIRERMKRAAA